MKMKKTGILALVVVGAMLVSFLGAGCSLVKVNPEEDKKQTVAEVDGNPILKESFNNYMAYYQMYFESSGMEFPTGDELTGLKKDILDDLVRVETMTVQAKKDGITVDEAPVLTEADTMIGSLKTSMGEEKYNTTLEKYNSDGTSFDAFLKKFLIDNNYANTLGTNFEAALKTDPSKELNTVVGKIGGNDVKKDVYNYRLSNEEFLTFYQTQEAMKTDEETMKTVNENIFNTIAQQAVLIKYAEENNMTPAQETIDTNFVSHQAFVNSILPGDEALQQFLDQKYLTVAQFREFEKQDAKATAVASAIQADLTGKVEVNDKDIQKYYDENKESYNTSTVSAKHILATEEVLAKEIYGEAKNAKTVEEFDAVMKKYEAVEGVQEASDLGAFTKGTMVSEFSDAAFGMEKNTVSEPIKTEFGYHVIYVYDKNDTGIPSFDEKKDEIRETLKNEKGLEEYSTFVEKLLKKEKTEINEITTPIEAYMEQLKTDLNVKVYEKRI